MLRFTFKEKEMSLVYLVYKSRSYFFIEPSRGQVRVPSETSLSKLNVSICFNSVGYIYR